MVVLSAASRTVLDACACSGSGVRPGGCRIPWGVRRCLSLLPCQSCQRSAQGPRPGVVVPTRRAGADRGNVAGLVRGAPLQPQADPQADAPRGRGPRAAPASQAGVASPRPRADAPRTGRRYVGQRWRDSTCGPTRRARAGAPAGRGPPTRPPRSPAAARPRHRRAKTDGDSRVELVDHETPPQTGQRPPDRPGARD